MAEAVRVGNGAGECLLTVHRLTKLQIDGVSLHREAAHLLLIEQRYHLRVGQTIVPGAEDAQHPGKQQYQKHHIDDHKGNFAIFQF